MVEMKNDFSFSLHFRITIEFYFGNYLIFLLRDLLCKIIGFFRSPETATQLPVKVARYQLVQDEAFDHHHPAEHLTAVSSKLLLGVC